MKKHIHSRFRTALKLGIITLFIITLLSSISGVYIDTSITFEIDSPLETYSLTEPMNFTQITIASTYIVFNTTGFNVTTASPIDIQIDDIVDDILHPSTVDEELVAFTVINNPGVTWFNISGFTPSLYYSVSRDGVHYDIYQANGIGSISIYDVDPEAKPFIISANGSTYSPIITTTGSATSITNNSAILYADLVYDGGESCNVWIEYGVNVSYGFNSSYNATKTTGGEFLYDFAWELQNPTSERLDTTDYIVLLRKQRFDCYGNVEVNYINYSLTKIYTGDDYDIQATFIEYNPSNVNYSETIVNTTSLSTFADVDWFNFKFNPPIQLVDIHEDESSHSYGFFVYNAKTVFNNLEVYSSGNNDYDYGAAHSAIFGDQDYDYCFIVNNGTSYRRNLSAGQLYHYRAVANNTNTTAYGADAAFLTLPNVTASGTAKGTGNFTTMNISFTPGTGANFTIIERNTTAGDWERGDATEIYNGTGTYFVDTGLIKDTSYYYRLWSVANWTYNPTVWQYSSGSGFYLFNSTAGLDPPYNGSSTYFPSTQFLNLTWSRGNFSDREIVVKNNNTWAINPGDGWVRQNSTNTWFNVSENATGYYTIWSYNSTENIYSLTGLNIPWGALSMQCYDEINHTGLTFDVLITNSTLSTLYLQNLTNYYHVDLNDIPFGDDTIFYVSSDGYESRTYYFDLVVNNFYNLTFYLPYAIPSGGTEDPEYDPDNITYSTLYLISVINEYDGPVEDAKIRIMRYINTTDTYENVTILMSDANGQADVYLYEGTVYKVNLSKDGYVSRTEEWIPSDSIFFKTFRLLWENVPIEPDVFGDIISFSGTLYVNNTIMVSYYDLEDATLDTHFMVYEDYNGTLTYMGEYTGTTSNDITSWINVINATRLHVVVLYMNHTVLGEVIDHRIVVYPVHVADRDSGNWLENLIRDVVGDFAYGYVITFLWYLPCAFIIIGLAAIKHPGVGILGAGFYSTWITWYFYIPEEAKILTFASIAFVMGAITLFLVKGKDVIHK